MAGRGSLFFAGAGGLRVPASPGRSTPALPRLFFKVLLQVKLALGENDGDQDFQLNNNPKRVVHTH